MQRSHKEVAAFYNSPEWKKVRKAYKLHKLNICERCGEIGYYVHHIIYITINNVHDPNITLNFDNLELLCEDCHNKEHFKKELGYRFDEDGQLCPPIEEFKINNGISV